MVDDFSVGFVFCDFVGGEGRWFRDLAGAGEEFGEGDDDFRAEYFLDKVYVAVSGHVVGYSLESVHFLCDNFEAFHDIISGILV